MDCTVLCCGVVCVCFSLSPLSPPAFYSILHQALLSSANKSLFLSHYFSYSKAHHLQLLSFAWLSLPPFYFGLHPSPSPHSMAKLGITWSLIPLVPRPCCTFTHRNTHAYTYMKTGGKWSAAGLLTSFIQSLKLRAIHSILSFVCMKLDIHILVKCKPGSPTGMLGWTFWGYRNAQTSSVSLRK